MIIDFIHFGIRDIIDILLFSLFLYYGYKLFRTSGNRTLFVGIIVFIVIWYLVSRVFTLRITGLLFDKILNVGVLVLVIIFQDEIKKFLSSLGSLKEFRFLKKMIAQEKEEVQSDAWISYLVLAVANMSKKYTGALIAVERNIDLSIYEHTGERFNSDLNARLIESIFFKNSPLHDGGMIISKGKIKAAGCILPVANNADLNKDLGLRHRAALGLSQKTDAIVIIVSEERGAISVAYHGEIKINIDPEDLTQIIKAV